MLGLATNPIPVKSAMQLLGMDTGELRLPMTPLNADQLESLREYVDFVWTALSRFNDPSCISCEFPSVNGGENSLLSFLASTPEEIEPIVLLSTSRPICRTSAATWYSERGPASCRFKWPKERPRVGQRRVTCDAEVSFSADRPCKQFVDVTMLGRIANQIIDSLFWPSQRHIECQ